MKIYDCSNSNERPTNRGYGGPVENAVVSMLKKYAFCYQSEFVTNIHEAEILFTNDVFPSDFVSMKIPRVKRMDGIFWQTHLKPRNESLNEAAIQSDCVIFISEFSRRSLRSLYPEVHCKKEIVILNAVDGSYFHPVPKTIKEMPAVWVTSATDWARAEKRFYSMLFFASLLQEDNAILYLIGTPPDCSLPHNIIQLDYIKAPKRIHSILKHADAFVNFSYRDAAPKTVIEAAFSGLPVLFADSGGTRELLTPGTLVSIDDPYGFIFEEHTPVLCTDDIGKGYNEMKENFKTLATNANMPQLREGKMLDNYFRTFQETLWRF